MPINDGRCCDSCNSIVIGARLWRKVRNTNEKYSRRKEKEKPDTPDIDSIAERNYENRNT